jgi:hypothetical protein
LGALYRAAIALNRTGARSIPDMSEVFPQVDNLTLTRRVRGRSVVIISLDRPFSGPAHIPPEALEHVLAIAEHG